MPPAAIAGAALAGSAAGSIVSGISGANAQEDAANTAAGLAQQGASQYENIDIPSIQQQQIQLQQIANAGNLTPQQEQTFQQNQSVLNSYQQNPEAFSAQMQALQSLQKLGQNNGLTAMDKAQLNQIQNQVNNQEQSNRNALVQNYAQRGLAGSGVQMAAQLAGNEAATKAASDQGFNVAAQAQQRALQAIQGAGQLGQNIEGQQFGEAAQKAQAQNAINNFNTANAQNIAGQNVQRTNYANQYNLQNQQQLNAANTGLANQQEVYNQGLYQQQFGNQMAQAGGISNALNKQAQAAEQQGNAEAGLYSGIGQSIAKVGTGIANYEAGTNADGTPKKTPTGTAANDQGNTVT